MIVKGIILKKALKSLDLTQQDAADKLGVSRQTVVNWCGKAELDIEILHIVKTNLGIDLEKYKPSSTISVAQDRDIEPYGDQRWVNPRLSVMENLEKLINFKNNGDITEKEFLRIKSKIIPE